MNFTTLSGMFNCFFVTTNFLRTLKLTLFLVVSLWANNSFAQHDILAASQRTLTSAENVVAKSQEFVTAIDNATQKVKDNQLYKALVDGKEFTFPIGILPASADKNYAIIINKVFMDSDGMYAEVFLKIKVSEEKKLYFMADRVPYSRSGGFAGELKLYLLKTDSFQVGKGYNVQFNGFDKGGIDKSCSVTFTCKGFKEVTIAGAVNFDKQTVVTDQDTKGKLSVLFYANADKLSNLIIQVDQIPTFEFTNLPGFKCKIPKFTLDQSDLKNAPDFKLPGWYKDSITAIISKNATAGANLSTDNAIDGPQWQGIYIPNITIEIPKAFKEKNPNEIVVINSKDLIIDGNGITALTSAKGVGTTPFYDGSIKSWEYRIDSLRLNLIASSLSSAGFYGGLTLPISKKETQVDFGLLLTKNISDSDVRYAGYIDIERKGGILEAQAFGVAKIKIDHASLNFNYYQKQFSPTATITGAIRLTPKKKGESSSAKATGGFGLDFANLVLSTKSPYIDIDSANGGYCRMSNSGQSMSNFPVQIKSIALIKEQAGQRLGIQLSLVVQFQKSGSGSSDAPPAASSSSTSAGASAGNGEEGGDGFGGSAKFTIWAKRNAATGKWEFDDIFIDKIVINVDNDAFKLYGQLSNFKDDKEYGTGFCGNISLTIMKGKLKVEVAGIFGRKGETIVPNVDQPTELAALVDKTTSYRYWFVDAGITFPVIPVAPFVGINGFTGGLYHHMKMQTPNDPAPDTDVECKTTSGLYYLPNLDVHLGLLAGIGLQSVPTEAIFNGKINLGMEFDKSGGVLIFAFFGEVAILTGAVPVPAVDKMKEKMQVDKLDKLSSAASKDAIKKEKPAENTGSVRVKWFTQYSFPTKTFIGDFDVFINVAEVVKGSMDGGEDKAAHIAVLFSPDAKYVYMGTPSDPAKIEVISLFECESYFCAGSVLPTPPMMPLPEEFGPPPINYDALETGAGLSFGARVKLEGGFDGSADFGPCAVNPYAKLWLSAGFDILITQTTKAVYCDEKERGINNWYATGQAFIMGGINVGCKYDCKEPFFVNGDFTLVEATISAYVFAQLPKPSYLKGAVNIEFDLLSLVRGKATFNVKFGKECANTELDKNIVFIETITPAYGSRDINVNENISVNFARAIEKFQFKLPDENNAGKEVEYRGFVGPNNVSIKSAGKEIKYTFKWNSDKTKLTVIPSTSYYDDSSVEVIVTVDLQLFNGSAWVASGKVEKDTTVFKVKREPFNIDVTNVEYAYPMPDMKNYYKNESNSGYIKMLSVQRKPMKLAPNFSYEVIFKQAGKEVARVKNVSTNPEPGADNFTYQIPNSVFQNGKVYDVELTKVVNTAQDRDVGDQKDTTRSLGTSALTPKDTIILKYSFTCSNYSSFNQKMAYFNQPKIESSGVHVLHTLAANARDVEAGSVEGLSPLETSGKKVLDATYSKQLVRSLGADFTQGFKLTGAGIPDTVRYSYFANKLQVQYDVFSELKSQKQKDITKAIKCTLASDGSGAECSAGFSGVKVPQGSVLYYKLGYFLPGKDIKTSEVLLNFTLPNDVTVQ